MSAYAEAETFRLDDLKREGRFLDKPFTNEALLRKIRETLDDAR